MAGAGPGQHISCRTVGAFAEAVRNAWLVQSISVLGPPCNDDKAADCKEASDRLLDLVSRGCIFGIQKERPLKELFPLGPPELSPVGFLSTLHRFAPNYVEAVLACAFASFSLARPRAALTLAGANVLAIYPPYNFFAVANKLPLGFRAERARLLAQLGSHGALLLALGSPVGRRGARRGLLVVACHAALRRRSAEEVLNAAEDVTLTQELRALGGLLGGVALGYCRAILNYMMPDKIGQRVRSNWTQHADHYFNFVIVSAFVNLFRARHKVLPLALLATNVYAGGKRNRVDGAWARRLAELLSSRRALLAGLACSGGAGRNGVLFGAVAVGGHSALRNRSVAAPERPHELCKICEDAPVDTLLYPCGHLALCHECSERVNKCPWCRGAVSQKVRTFRA